MASNRLLVRGWMSVHKSNHLVLGGFARAYSIETDVMLAMASAAVTVMVTVGSAAYVSARKLGNLESDINTLAAALKGDAAALKGELYTKLAGDLGKLTGEIKLMSSDLSKLDAKLTGDIGKLDAKLAGDIGKLDTKVEETVKRVESNTRAFAEAEAHKVINMFAKKA